MNLHRISDTQSAGMYKMLSDKQAGFPDNFYCCLIAKIAPILLDKKKKATEGQIESAFRVLGNECAFSYPRLSLAINLQAIPATGKGIEWLKDAIIKCYAAEASGSLTIKRPEGHDRSTDRLDFKKCTATFLPSIAQQVAYATGHQDLGSMKNGTANRKNFLTAAEYAKYKPSGFTEYKNKECTYYIKNSVQCIDVTDLCPASRAMYAVQNPGQPKSAELIARSDLGDLFDPNPQNPFYVVVSGKEAFNVEATDAGVSVRNINVDNKLVKEVAKDIKPVVDPVDIEFENWCKENNKPKTEKSFNEFKAIPEFKHLFDSRRKSMGRE